MQLNSIFPRVSGRIVSVKLVWIRGNPGYMPNGPNLGPEITEKAARVPAGPIPPDTSGSFG